MEFLRHSRRRSILSETVYILLNVLMAVAILIVVLVIESPLPALALVLLSKWRVLAVRPQYWPAHIVANSVDIIVSLGFVVFLWAATGALYVQIGLTLLYITWLLFLKPRSTRFWITMQAGVATFVGVSALMQVSYDWWDVVVVLAMWVIGFAAARHVLTSYQEPHFSVLSLLWGMIMAELGWLFYHWSFAYDLRITGDLMLSQAALVVTLLAFLAERVYVSYYHNKSVRMTDILLPLLLVVSSIGLLLTVFGQIQTI
jgi:hypothetical protein